ncbi:cyclic nucleotide-binding domain-containing protein [candidate division TA06 bacterium]|uniref:Cyclic nucleotide-binding domain-containing protein n=1 Tax=candidate division TA06 bacterium TaxID=2250710 RepID=A0A933MHJ0_UNCT6|nr:cyclic nucleotide-binding domain-containing protein [candidate division TA06 bacterium]
MVDKKLLKDNSLFSDCSQSEIDKLSPLFSERSYVANQVMIPEQSENRELMILLEGSVAVEVALSLSASAEKLMLTSETSPGRIIEWSSAIDTTKSGGTASARALKPTKVLVADGQALVGLLKSEKELGYKLMQKILLVIASRLKDTRLQLISMAAQCR